MTQQYDLEHRLAIFVSDEVQFWHASRKSPRPSDVHLRETTLSNVEAVCRRAKLLSCKMEREKVRNIEMRLKSRWTSLTIGLLMICRSRSEQTQLIRLF